MRLARFFSLLGHKALALVLAGGLGFCGWGCHQHHYYYYGNSPGCPPMTALPSTVQAGSVCEVPAGTIDGGIPVVSSTPRATVIKNGRKSRVVVSEPAGSGSRFSWRSSDSDSATAVTHVDGALEDSAVR